MSRSVVVVLLCLLACGVPEEAPPEASSPPAGSSAFVAPVRPSVHVATVAPPSTPFVSRFSPQQGAPGTRVVLVGAGFSPRPEENRVLFGGVRCGVPARMVSSSEAMLEFEVPEFAVTTTLTVFAGVQSIVTAEPFIVLQHPVLFDVQPASMLVDSTDAPLTLVGDGFVGTPAVTLDGVALAVLERTPTRLTTLVPAGLKTSARVVKLRVEGAPMEVDLTIEHPAPGDAMVTPAVAHSRVTEVSVEAPGARPTSIVLIDHQPVPTRWETGRLIAQLPALVSGPHLVMVHTPAPGGGTGAPATLTVVP